MFEDLRKFNSVFSECPLLELQVISGRWINVFFELIVTRASDSIREVFDD